MNSQSKLTKRQQQNRLNELNKKFTGNIIIEDVAIIFGMSVKNARHYKDLGLIVSVDKEGTRDLFDIVDIRTRKKIIRRLKKDNTLRQIKKMLDYELEKLKGGSSSLAPEG